MKLWRTGLTVAAALFAGAAFAQYEAEEVDEKAESKIEEWDRSTDLDEKVQARIEASDAPGAPMTVTLQGGLGGFTDQLGDSTEVGPVWGVRVGSERWGVLGAEIAYEGSRQGIEQSEASLFRHNVSAMAKAGVNVTENVRPFIGAGLGISYVNASDGAAEPFRNDILQELPLAAGVEYRVGALTAGLRASYNVLFNDEFMEPTPAADNPDGGLLSTSLTVGGRF